MKNFSSFFNFSSLLLLFCIIEFLCIYFAVIDHNLTNSENLAARANQSRRQTLSNVLLFKIIFLKKRLFTVNCQYHAKKKKKKKEKETNVKMAIYSQLSIAKNR